MPFSEGQIAFAIFFIVVFALGISWAYITDAKKQKRYFRGSVRILAILVVTYFVFFVLFRLIG